jgi:hypothetical protein
MDTLGFELGANLLPTCIGEFAVPCSTHIDAGRKDRHIVAEPNTEWAILDAKAVKT